MRPLNRNGVDQKLRIRGRPSLSREYCKPEAPRKPTEVSWRTAAGSFKVLIASYWVATAFVDPECLGARIIRLQHQFVASFAASVLLVERAQMMRKFYHRDALRELIARRRSSRGKWRWRQRPAGHRSDRSGPDLECSHPG
jgi:hypothetical protein